MAKIWISIQDEGKTRKRTLTLKEGERQEVGRLSKWLKLKSTSVSRKHAFLEIRDEKIYFEDLESTSGTYLNQKRVTSGYLSEGDQVLFGESLVQILKLEGAQSEIRPQLVVSKKPTSRSKSKSNPSSKGQIQQYLMGAAIVVVSTGLAFLLFRDPEVLESEMTEASVIETDMESSTPVVAEVEPQSKSQTPNRAPSSKPQVRSLDTLIAEISALSALQHVELQNLCQQVQQSLQEELKSITSNREVALRERYLRIFHPYFDALKEVNSNHSSHPDDGEFADEHRILSPDLLEFGIEVREHPSYQAYNPHAQSTVEKYQVLAVCLQVDLEALKAHRPGSRFD